jgi:AcrR family transcriptional regulator
MNSAAFRPAEAARAAADPRDAPAVPDPQDARASPDPQRPIPPQIVDAARHVLAQDGLAAATLQRISEAAGVSRMTLHRRGVSKLGILEALAAQLESDYREAFWPALVSKGSGRERLMTALTGLCAVTERNLALHDVLSVHARDQVHHARGPEGLAHAVFGEPLERLLIDGAGDGSLAPLGDSGETATLVFDTVTQTYARLRQAHDWSPERARDGLLELVTDGLGGGIRFNAR